MSKNASKKPIKKSKRKEDRYSSVREFYEFFAIRKADTAPEVEKNLEAYTTNMDELIHSLGHLGGLILEKWPDLNEEDPAVMIENAVEFRSFIDSTLEAFAMIESYKGKYLDPDQIPQEIQESLETGFALADFTRHLAQAMGDLIHLSARQAEPVLKAALEWMTDHRKLLNGKILCTGCDAFLLAVYIAKLRSFAKVYWENHLQNEQWQRLGIERYLFLEGPAGIAKVENISYITDQTILEEAPYDMAVIAEELQDWKSPYLSLSKQEEDPDQPQPTLQESAQALVDRLCHLVKKGGLIVDIECAKSADELEEWSTALIQQGLIEVSKEKPSIVNWSDGDGYLSIKMYSCPEFEQSESKHQLVENDETQFMHRLSKMSMMDFIMQLFDPTHQWI